LAELQRTHRSETLKAVGAEGVTADQAMARIETVRRLEAMTRHAWRAAAHLLGRFDDAG
jgi:phosphate:Na+ symporter